MAATECCAHGLDVHWIIWRYGLWPTDERCSSGRDEYLFCIREKGGIVMLLVGNGRLVTRGMPKRWGILHNYAQNIRMPNGSTPKAE